jgi:hypothetical protein
MDLPETLDALYKSGVIASWDRLVYGGELAYWVVGQGSDMPEVVITESGSILTPLGQEVVE